MRVLIFAVHQSQGSFEFLSNWVEVLRKRSCSIRWTQRPQTQIPPTPDPKTPEVNKNIVHCAIGLVSKLSKLSKKKGYR